MDPFKRLLTWHRLPALTWHVPTLPTHATLALRHRRLLYFATANPLQSRRGFREVGKQRLLEALPPESKPAAFRLEPGCGLSDLMEWLEEVRLGFPLIVKPDVGERGSGVRVVSNQNELEASVRSRRVALIVQEFVHGIEAGVLYARRPGEPRGSITSLTLKQPPCVVGDGRADLETLLRRDLPRRLLPRALDQNRKRLGQVPAREESVLVEPIAQPFLGTKMVSLQSQRSQALERAIERWARSIDGFHVGRFDLKAPSVEHLLRGEGLRALELNLTASIPLHIWDERLSAREALRELAAHWQLVAEIAEANRRRGVAEVALREAISALTRQRRRSAL